ncbi:MAG: hypothetical protein KJ060_20010, partial [Candidatus Hydrogenedentes bacterium]|nr:hypothetical protein [Candidatus Hydrogenedentota bacterium]
AVMFFLIVFVLPSIAMAFVDATIPEVLRSSGLALLIGGFVIANVIRWPLGKGKCQTEIAVTTDRGKRRLIFTRVQGEDDAFEELLDHLQRVESDASAAPVMGCVMELSASWGSVLKYSIYAVGALSVLVGSLLEVEGMSDPRYLYVTVAGVIVCGLIVTLVIDPRPSASARAARRALREGDLDTAALILRNILEKKPYHAYANYLMTAHALATGDLDAAARHRAAMNGPANRERLSVIAIDFAHTVSSEPAFRKLVAYAHGEGEVGAETVSQVSP